MEQSLGQRLRRGLAASGAVLRLVSARQAARPWRAALVLAGIALAIAALGVAVGGGLVAGDLRAKRGLASLPDQERTLRVDAFDLRPGGGQRALDRVGTGALADLGVRDPARAVLFRGADIGGRAVELAGVAPLPRWIALASGRAPGPCRPARCEMVQVDGRPVERVDASDVRLVVVGRGRLRSTVPFGTDVRSGAGGLAPGTPILVAGDVRGLADLGGLSFLYRTASWSAPLDTGAVHPWLVDGMLARERAVQDRLFAFGSGSAITLTAPDQALLDARSAGRVASRRLLIVGGACAALLAGFALLAAGAMRRDLADERARLAQRGGRTFHRALLTAAESAWVALVAGVVALALAVAGVALAARAADLPADAVLSHSVLAPHGIWVLALATLLAAAGLAIAASLSAEGEARVGRLRLGDVVAIGAVAAVALAAARGGARADALASGDVDPLIPALPILVSLAAGILTARVVGPALRLAERGSRRGPLALRLALVSLARRPGRAAMTAAFLVVALGLAAFAGSYRATLARGERDQAAYRVPLDMTLAPGPSSAGPLEAAPLSAYRRLGGGGEALPVLRAPVNVAGIGSLLTPTTLIGVPADGLGSLHGWRPDFAPASRDEIARLLSGPAPAGLRGAAIPAGTRTLAVSVARSGGPLVLSLVVQGRDGRVSRLRLGEPASGGTLVAAVPATIRGARIVALEASLRPADQFGLLHAEAEGHGGPAIAGRLRLGPLVARGAGAAHPLVTWTGWAGRGGLRGSGGEVGYALGGESTALLRPEQPFDRKAVPLLASADLAAAAGVGAPLDVELPGGQEVHGRIVAAARHFPTAPDDGTGFLVADQRSLAAAIDADDPGAGEATEVWVGASSDAARRRLAAAARRPPFAGLERADRGAVQADLAADPLSRGILVALEVTAGLAVALGLAGLLLSLAGDMRDERPHFADLEAQGVGPATLRAELRLRTLVVAAIGVLGGLALGAALAALVVRLVLLTAGADPPTPPLVRSMGWGWTGIGLAAFAVAATALVLIATASAFRSRPVPAAGGRR
ncbi:MAG TPA: FtsX-like permease family protein [Miltoncostaeaceae bacterium]|nr:FtsX-like permease family protein [Miltoncostaeaceae bacterium]